MQLLQTTAVLKTFLKLPIWASVPVFKWEKYIPGFSDLSFRDVCPQNSNSITKPNLVSHFPTPQFPSSLMGIIAWPHFPSWSLAGALRCWKQATFHHPHSPRLLCYSAEMQMDQQLAQRKLPPPPGWGTGNIWQTSAPNPVLWVSKATVWVLPLGNISHPMPSHQDTSLNATCGHSSRCSSLLGPKILHAGAREHIPKVQRTPTLHRDAKKPRQGYQNVCGTKMFLSWVQSHPCTVSSTAFPKQGEGLTCNSSLLHQAARIIHQCAKLSISQVHSQLAKPQVIRAHSHQWFRRVSTEPQCGIQECPGKWWDPVGHAGSSAHDWLNHR